MTSNVSGPHAALVGVEVLVLDGDQRVHAGIEQLLSEASLHVTCTSDPERALALVDRQFFSVALVDIDTPSPRAGIETIALVKSKSPTTMVIALTPRRSYDDAVDAVRAGALDLILKAPESVAYLKDRVLDAAGRSVGKREVDTVLDDIKRVHEEFLQRFMEAEKRAIDLADQVAGRDPSKSSLNEDLRVLVIDEVDEMYDALESAKPRGFTFLHATSGGEGLDRVSSGKFHYAMVAEDISDLPAKTVARTIRNQQPDTVVLTFLGPVGQRPRRPGRDPRLAHDREAVRRPAAADRAPGRARRGVAREGARAPLHAGVPRAPLRLPAPLRRDQDEDRARDERRTRVARSSSANQGRRRCTRSHTRRVESVARFAL